jgi:DsbC/DsbD-like thiol-disulfide interchange protein
VRLSVARPAGALAGHVALAAVLAAVAIVAGAPARAAAGDAQARPAWLADAPAAEASTPHLEVKALPPVRGRNGQVTLRLHVAPRPGMRIYASDARGYVPLSLSLDVPDGAAVVGQPAYPAPEEYVFPPTGERSRVYDAPFTVAQRIRPGRAGLAGVTGTLRYQACDDRLCYKPSSVTVRWTPDGP